MPRSDLYIAGSTSTLVPGSTCVDEASCYQMTRAQAELQVELLTWDGTPLDQLMVVNFPASHDCGLVRGPWRALEELQRAGRVRSLGTSNAAGADEAASMGGEWKLRCLSNATSAPAVSQEPFCIGHASDPARANLASHGGIWLQAFSPLGHGALLSDPRVNAIASEHGVSAAAVALRWITQRNATLITNSNNPAHLRSDTSIFDFALSTANLAALDAITSGEMCGNWSSMVARHSPLAEIEKPVAAPLPLPHRTHVLSELRVL